MVGVVVGDQDQVQVTKGLEAVGVRSRVEQHM